MEASSRINTVTSPQQQQQQQVWQKGGFVDMDDHRPHPKCLACKGTRLLSSPMVVIVMALVLLTYVPYVMLNTRTDTVANVCKAILTVLVALLLASYLQCVMIDAGSVPKWWVVEAQQRHPGQHLICRKSNLPKPPRTHFDSMTNRLVLNMDHFCPWVANTVGFYNRKFFILFLVYACLACCFAAVTILILFRDQALSSFTCKQGSACPKHQRIMLVALIFDGIFGSILICFAGFHIEMAMRNETTIESSAGKYDVGTRRNWEQVFGTNPWLWFLPVWGSGPVGDGLTWQTQDDEDDLPL